MAYIIYIGENPSLRINKDPLIAVKLAYLKLHFGLDVKVVEEYNMITVSLRDLKSRLYAYSVIDRHIKSISLEYHNEYVRTENGKIICNHHWGQYPYRSWPITHSEDIMLASEIDYLEVLFDKLKDDPAAIKIQVKE